MCIAAGGKKKKNFHHQIWYFLKDGQKFERISSLFSTKSTKVLRVSELWWNFHFGDGKIPLLSQKLRQKEWRICNTRYWALERVFVTNGDDNNEGRKRMMQWSSSFWHQPVCLPLFPSLWMPANKAVCVSEVSASLPTPPAQPQLHNHCLDSLITPLHFLPRAE